MFFLNQIRENIKKYRNLLENNEAQTRWLLIDVLLLNILEYPRENIITEYLLEKNESKRDNKLDYLVLHNNKPKILIEAKSLGLDLIKNYNQLNKYFKTILSKDSYNSGELIGILTDGDKYLFYSNKVNKDKMDRAPFFTIQLSIADDCEIKNLMKFSNKQIKDSVNIDFEEEYEKNTAYRIDMLEKVFGYFEIKDIPVKISSIYINGRLSKNKNLKSLYRDIVNLVNSQKPEFFYYLALEEDKNNLGKNSISHFSLKHISSSEFIIKTNLGEIYVSLPCSRNLLIERIVFLAEKSGIGIQNILVTVK